MTTAQAEDLTNWRVHRARKAALTRSRSADDPELLDADQRLHAARLADHVQKALASRPPLTEDQKRDIARLLTGGGPGAAA